MGEGRGGGRGTVVVVVGGVVTVVAGAGRVGGGVAGEARPVANAAGVAADVEGTVGGDAAGDREEQPATTLMRASAANRAESSGRRRSGGWRGPGDSVTRRPSGANLRLPLTKKPFPSAVGRCRRPASLLAFADQ